jgi:DNA-binding NtrC family response regulator
MESDLQANVDLSLHSKIEALQKLALHIALEANSFAPKSWLKLENGINLWEELRNYEQRLIRQALALSGGKQNKAASLLGISSSTLNAKIKRLGLLHEQ